MKYKVLFALTFCTFALTPVFGQVGPIPVNCALGQSLNQTLSRIRNLRSAMVVVTGTCTEYVAINGFDGLTLKGAPGATLQQPATTPSNGLGVWVLSIGAAQSVTVDGFTIHSAASALGAIGIGQNSTDVRLRNLAIDGPAIFGIEIFEGSQVSLAGVTARDAGFATLAALDLSDVHIEQSLFEETTGGGFHEGIVASSGHVTVQSTTIRDMQVGIGISSHGSVDIQSFNTYFPVVRPKCNLIATNWNARNVRLSSSIAEERSECFGRYGGTPAYVWGSLALFAYTVENQRSGPNSVLRVQS
jgi:hypothetical protein